MAMVPRTLAEVCSQELDEKLQGCNLPGKEQGCNLRGEDQDCIQQLEVVEEHILLQNKVELEQDQ